MDGLTIMKTKRARLNLGYGTKRTLRRQDGKVLDGLGKVTRDASKAGLTIGAVETEPNEPSETSLFACSQVQEPGENGTRGGNGQRVDRGRSRVVD